MIEIQGTKVCSEGERRELWSQLRAADRNAPLLLAIDWNFCVGSGNSGQWRELMNHYDLQDVCEIGGCKPLEGSTWSNRQFDGTYLTRRLDTFYASNMANWMGNDSTGCLMHTYNVSDHAPLRLQFRITTFSRVCKGPPAFKFHLSFLKDKAHF